MARCIRLIPAGGMRPGVVGRMCAAYYAVSRSSGVPGSVFDTQHVVPSPWNSSHNHGSITSSTELRGRRLQNQVSTVGTQHGERFERDPSISPIYFPFKQKPGEWGNEGKGISMGSTGEPKSGTTWMQTIITKIALQLCGSPSNSWCKMGGLKIIPNKAGPSYEWEMLYADSEELYLHFAVEGRKHTIPGFGVGHGCNELGRHHRDSFEKFYPCKDTTGRISRDQLLRCLPDTSERCAREMPSRDPSVERMSVVFRDPRNVVISERRYKKKILHMEDLPNLDDYIHQRFENIVSWQHQRWVWHTTFYQNVSHVMIYEEVKAHQSSLVDLAAFLGLDCSPEEALVIWQMHHEYKPNSSTHRTFNSYGLPLETIGWMNSTMMALLPEDLVPRWGLRPPPA